MDTQSFSQCLGDILPSTVLPKHIELPEQVASIACTGIQLDSRKVVPGDLFIALKGTNTEGAIFVADAVAKGAVAILQDASALEVGSLLNGLGYFNSIPIIPINHLNASASVIAGRFYRDPSKYLQVIGVTGTNGKSTTVSLLAQLYECVAGSAATLGTLGVFAKGQLIQDTGMTTPDAISCQKMLAELRNQRVGMVAMEVSSHGLDQHRVSGVHFRTGVFTNLSHDHLDYHGTLQSYAAAKQKLFDSFGLQAAVINLDDAFAPQMVAAAKNKSDVYSYSLLHFAADVYATDLRYRVHGVEFSLRTPWGKAIIHSPLLGEFNVYNLLAAFTALCTLGCDFHELVSAIPQLAPVPGRMQRVSLAKDSLADDIVAVVDYAHTPDALLQAIAATKVHAPGKLWVVFGCGGDRDRTKRAVMAEVAEQHADHVVVTSDNPRTEDANVIIQDICAGFKKPEYHILPLREEAIAYAILQAKAGDAVLIAGKGHETYQIIGTEKYPFSDVEQVEKALLMRRHRVEDVTHEIV